MQGKCLLDIDDGIDTETTQTFVQPPVNIFVNFLSYFLILPVQIRLFLMEYMEILLIGSRQILPYRTTEIGAPVGRQFPFFLISQVKIFSVLSIRIFTGFFEPFMFIGTMVYNQIHQDVHISLLRFRDQFIHIFHGSETRINIIII